MKLIKGELFREIENVDYFDAHNANFENLKTNKIITHNSDYSTSDVLLLHNNYSIFYNNENLIWFAQNVDIDHPRIFPIPIGLENSQWFPGLNKENKIRHLHLNPLTKNNLCLAAFNTGTHPQRVSVLDYFLKQDWCLASYAQNGNNFDGYIQTLASSKFCICPRGNGIDTHRIWEALYVKTIPIVEKCINAKHFYAPIILIKDLKLVTQELLLEIEKQLPPFGSPEHLAMFDTPHLNFNFWKEHITKYEN